MRITEALHAEHATLYAQLDFLARAAAASPGAAEARAYAAILGAALRSHADLEDELLFAELERQLGAMGQLTVMRAEHEELQATLELLSELCGDQDPAPLLRRLVDVARAHFDKEEQVLFPIADDAVPAWRSEDAAKRWAERRFISDRDQW